MGLEGDSGIVLTLVPESLRGPHMAKLGEDRYYKRSGDSVYRMEHFDLEDMFGRRARPDLTVSLVIRKGGNMSSGGRFTYRGEVVVALENVGRGTARAPYLMFSLNQPYRVSRHGVDGNGSHGLPHIKHSLTDRLPHRFGADSTVVIHPGMRLEVCAVQLQVSDRTHGEPDLKLDWAAVAEGMALRSGSAAVAGRDICVALVPGYAD